MDPMGDREEPEMNTHGMSERTSLDNDIPTEAIGTREREETSGGMYEKRHLEGTGNRHGHSDLAPNTHHTGNGQRSRHGSSGPRQVIGRKPPPTGNKDPDPDKLSSSLAAIARHTRAKSEAEGLGSSSDSAGGGEEEDSSSSSANPASAGSGSGSGAAAVTATTGTNSSGDDRYSSGVHGSGASRGNTSGDSKEDQYHRVRRRPHPESLSIKQRPNDGYGLPVPIDDHLQRQGGTGANTGHATVVARLPPPQTDSSGSSGEGDQGSSEDKTQGESGSLLRPHHEPGLHTIRRTFSKLPKRDAIPGGRHSETESSKSASFKMPEKPPKPKLSKKPSSGAVVGDPKRRLLNRESGTMSPDSDDSNPEGEGSSSGSGTEGGYAGSASSNENIMVQQSSCSSPSVSSSEESSESKTKAQKRSKAKRSNRGVLGRSMRSEKSSSSSEIADFSSGGSSENMNAIGFDTFTASSMFPPMSSSSCEGLSDELNDEFLKEDSSSLQSGGRKRRHQDRNADKKDLKRPPYGLSHRPFAAKGRSKTISTAAEEVDDVKRPRSRPAQLKDDLSKTLSRKRPASRVMSDMKIAGKPPILALGSDIMVHVLTFLEPPEIYDVLTMPLSKEWVATFADANELWRVLCVLDPFKAMLDNEDDDDSSDESLNSFPMNPEYDARQVFGRYRLLYSSFVRCMRYLERIKDDAIHGRAPSVIDYGSQDVLKRHIGANQSLKNFLAEAQGVIVRNGNQDMSSGNSSDSSSSEENDGVARRIPLNDEPIGVTDDSSSIESGPKRKKRKVVKSQPGVKLAHSKLTERLLGPSSSGEPGSVELPWSCAIYSIVNWMVAFSDVEGIQTMCLKVLPFLLEDEQQRMTAQRAGLTDVVLRGMVLFSNSVQLHTAAFHTIVLLARPLGGREGMLFHSTMVNSSGIFNGSGKNGIAVMLDSMRRFEDNEVLQAMSCWSLVNIALAPSQKEMLVKLGGIGVTANAMMRHPHNPEVQFRALFALINLVIPSVNLAVDPEADEMRQQLGEVNDTTEKEMLDEWVGNIADLTILAMKNFCSSEAILNRACLVLHNLSLTVDYHPTLLWTPNCYQMLEWCLANYRTDQVLQQSAAGTLHRLQLTLSNDDNLRARFAASVQAQQRLSLEEAHREAVHLNEQQERLRREQS